MSPNYVGAMLHFLKLARLNVIIPLCFPNCIGKPGCHMTVSHSVQLFAVHISHIFYKRTHVKNGFDDFAP